MKGNSVMAELKYDKKTGRLISVNLKIKFHIISMKKIKLNL